MKRSSPERWERQRASPLHGRSGQPPQYLQSLEANGGAGRHFASLAAPKKRQLGRAGAQAAAHN